MYLIVTLFVNFKHNFHKENKTFSPKKLKRFKEKSLKMEPFLSELPYHIYDWLIISLKDFCIVIRKWPTFLPSICAPEICIVEIKNGKYDNEMCELLCTVIITVKKGNIVYI